MLLISPYNSFYYFWVSGPKYGNQKTKEKGGRYLNLLLEEFLLVEFCLLMIRNDLPWLPLIFSRKKALKSTCNCCHKCNQKSIRHTCMHYGPFS